MTKTGVHNVTYHWSIVSVCKMHWKNFEVISTGEEHKVYFREKIDKHEQAKRLGFLVNKDIINSVLGCCSFVSRIISKASCNIKIISVEKMVQKTTRLNREVQ